jgi:hypothetical protein
MMLVPGQPVVVAVAADRRVAEMLFVRVAASSN